MLNPISSRAKTKSQARKADAANKKGEEGSVSGTNAPEAAENGGSQPPSPVAASSPLPGADNSGLTGTATPRTPSLSSEEGAPSTNAQAAEINSPDSGSGTSSSPRTITEVSPTAKPQPIPSPNSNAARGDSEPSDLSVGINTSLFGNPFPFGPPPAESSAGSSPSIPPTPADQRGMGLGSGLMAIPEHLRNQRRPSLPIIVSPPVGGNQSFLGQDLSPHQQRVSPLSFMQQGEHMRSDTGTGNTLLDPSIRRRSVDINMTRLGVHPYAHLATNAGGAQAGDLNLLRRGSMPHVLDPQMMTNGLVNRSNGMLGPQTHAHPVRRPGMYSRMSMPQLMHMQEETTNFDESPPRISQPFNGNPNLPANLVHFGARFSVPSREISAPIPGPLPSPGFSFGDAPTSTDSNGSPNLAAPSTSSHPRFLLNTRRSLSGPAEDADTEDDASAISSNYPFSRFGSFASVAGSESSFTSGGGWSESGSGKAHSQHRGSDGQLHAENMNNGFERRPSASGQMLELFHDLGVSGNGNHTPQPHSQPLSRSRSGDGSEGNGHDPTTSGGVGGGSNNNADMQGADGSELAYALRQDKDAASTDVLQYPGGYSPGSDQRLGHRLSDDVNGQYGYPNHDEHQHQQTMPKQEFPGSYSESGYAYGPSSNHNALHFEFMGGAGAGGSGPYHNGAIELSNMCVPASMDYHVVAPYMQYS
ncbi:hypothetical protein BXZ70DRAFT_32308 [Cristinia sonorae]|uniref:Uncharacterized protein n=1 Tax=Cristinia sonorae TaxID=1940300 RepID=A0A8K0UYU7_9AGAR|nr:hypothetical protein BXZ70DRAFT_32308 [Cristinia sonorae]